jgi:hypothetical protein
MELPAGGPLADCAYSQTGDRMATCSGAGAVQVWACGSGGAAGGGGGGGGGGGPELLHSVKVGGGGAVGRGFLFAAAPGRPRPPPCSGACLSPRHAPRTPSRGPPSLPDPAPPSPLQLPEQPTKLAWAPPELGSICAAGTAGGTVRVLRARGGGGWGSGGTLACGRGAVT